MRPRKRGHEAGGCGEEGDSSRSWILGVAKSLCLDRFDECGFSGLGCGTQETSSGLVWSEYGWAGSHPEVCPSRIRVGHGETSMRDQAGCTQRKEHFKREDGDQGWHEKVGGHESLMQESCG